MASPDSQLVSDGDYRTNECGNFQRLITLEPDRACIYAEQKHEEGNAC
jgi:hypothetical protein